MSTKIYNGLIATDNDPFIIAKKIRTVLDEIYLDKIETYRKKITDDPTNTWCDIFDCSWLYLDDAEFEKPVFEKPVQLTHGIEILKRLYAMLEREKRITTNTGMSNPMYDVVIAPNENPDNNHPLILVYSGMTDEYINALNESGVTQNYAYWDNTDKPDDVSNEEWESRKVSWEQIDQCESKLFIHNPGGLLTTLKTIERTKKNGKPQHPVSYETQQ